VPEGKGQGIPVLRPHGYRSNKDRTSSTALAEEFSGDKIVFFRFDMHGHGESEGNPAVTDARQCVDDVMRAIGYLRTLAVVDPRKIAITGSSLGGLATTLAAAWDDVACAVPVCPVSSYEPFSSRAIDFHALPKDNVYAEAEKIKCQVLVVHGDKDDIVPIGQSKELVKHLKKGKLHVVKGADHQFSDEKHFREMIKTVADFIRKVLL
jgi:dipeptidyl aminopeptidase/acylaminoacyl peptidase